MILRILLSSTFVVVLCVESDRSTPVYVRRAKDASLVPNASVVIRTMTGQTKDALPPGNTGSRGEPWNADTTTLDSSQKHRVIAETRNQDASGWADIVFQNGMWGERRIDGTWIEPPIVVRIKPRITERSSVPAGSAGECGRTQEMRWVCECCRDPCGQWYQVCRPVYCCCVTTRSIAPVTKDCYREIEGDTVTGSVGEATLTVLVPSDAAVFINGRPTTSKGDRRVYVSKGLMYGYCYGYVVRAQVTRNGKIVEDAQNIVLRPGESKEIVLDFSGRDTSRGCP